MTLDRNTLYLKNLSKANAKWISKVLLVGLMLSTTIVIIKLTKNKSFFSFQSIDIPLNYAWAPFIIITLAHLYTTWIFISSTRKFWEQSEPKIYGELFIEITSEGGLFMRGMKPRILLNGHIAYMHNDPSTWISHIAAFLLLAAIIPFELKLSLNTILGLIIVWINWMVGSQWAVALSELAVEKKYSRILVRKIYNVPTIWDEPDEN